MGFDPSKLTPAPWTVAQDQVGHWMVLWPHSGRSSVGRNDKFSDEDDAAFVALARNAFDVMMRRGWNPSLNGDGSWGVVMMITLGSAYRAGTFDRHVSRYPDPFTALVEADRWYKENIEAADGHEA